EPAQRYATPERAAQALQVFLTGAHETINADIPAPLRNYLNWLESTEIAAATVEPRLNQPAKAAAEPARALATGGEPAATRPAPASKKAIPIGRPVGPAAASPQSARQAATKPKPAPVPDRAVTRGKPESSADEYDVEL